MDTTTNINVTSKKTYSIKPTSIQTPQVDTQKKDTTSSNSQSTDIVIQTTKTIENEQAKFKENILRMIQTNFKDLTQEQSNEFAIQLAELRSKLTNKIEFLEYKKSNNLPYNQDDKTYFNKLYHFLDSQNINFIKALKGKFERSIYIVGLEDNKGVEIKDTIISERQQKLDKIEENKTEKKILKKLYTKNIELRQICDMAKMLFQNDRIKDEDMPKYLELKQKHTILCEEMKNLNNLLRNPINEKLSSYASDSKLSKIIDNEKEKTQGLSSKVLMNPFDTQAIDSRIEELRTADIDLKNQINSEDADLLYNIKSLETQIETLKERYLASNDSIKKNEFSNQIKSLEKEFKLKKELLNNLERVTQGTMYYQMETTTYFVDNYYTYNNKALTSKQINIYKRDYKKFQTIIKEKKLPFNMSSFNITDPDRVMDLKKQDLKNLRYYLNYINTYYSREHTEYSFMQQGDSEQAKLVTPSHPDGVVVGNNLSQKTLKNLLKLKKETGTIDLSSKQGKIGDCYLLTAMDQMLHNEDDLIDLLNCFSEEVVEACDEEGNITNLKRLVFTAKKGEPPFKMRFNINEDGSIQLKGYFNNQEKVFAGSPIVNIVEEIYTQVRFNDMKANLDNDDPLKKLEFSEANLKTLTFLTNIINVLSNQNSARPEDIDKAIEDYKNNFNSFVPEELKNSKEVLFIEKSINNVSIKKQSDNFTDFSNKIPANLSIEQDPKEWIQYLSSNIKDPTIQRLLSKEQDPSRKQQIVIQYSQLAKIQENINYVLNNKDLLKEGTSRKKDDEKQIWFRIHAKIYFDLVGNAKFSPEIKNSDSYKALYQSMNGLLDLDHFDLELFDSNLLSQSFQKQNSIVHNETLQILVRNKNKNSTPNIYNNLLSGGWVHKVLNTFLSSSHENIFLNNNPSQDIFNTQYENIQMFQPENFTPSSFDLRGTITPNSNKTQPEHKFYETEYDKANFGLYQANADRNKLGLISSHAINSEGILNGIDFNINPWDNDMVLLRTVEQYNQLQAGMKISITRRKKV